MKKTSLLVALSALSFHVKAQNHWYVLPQLNIGVSGIKQGIKEDYISNLPAYGAKLGVGYHIHNWRLETGAQYLVTGYKQGLLFASSFPNTTPTGSIKTTYSEISIPLSVGYQIPVSSKFTFVPYVGFAAGLTLNGHYKTTVPGEETHSGKIDSKSFDAFYHKFNIWGSSALHIEYKISKRMEIVAGPSFQYMLTNFMKKPLAPIPDINDSQHNYMLAFDAGVKINL